MALKKIKISNKEIAQLLSGGSPSFPKYSTQILNLANQNAQGTRPSVVGQLSELIKEFKGGGLKNWEKWYKGKEPDGIERAIEKISDMVEKLKDSIGKINKDMIREWVTDLVIVKTFAGLKFQEAIIKRIAEDVGENYRLATPEEESRGIDGYVGNDPVSIKPTTYKTKAALPESINYRIVYYEKKKDGIVIEFDS